MALSTALQSGNVAVAVTIGVLVVVFLGYLVVAVPIVGITVAVLVVIPFGLLTVRRAQEYEADAIAARIGYGDALALLLMMTTPPGATARSGWRHRIGQSHPSNPERVNRLQSLANRERQSE